MLWEELTSEEFAQAVKETGGTCLLPIGCIEKHGQHLPIGMDMYGCRDMAKRIADIEPVIVFPYYFFGQINEAKHCPGTIAMSTDLILKVLEDMCNEISRNGCKKIVFLNGHGGNKHFLRYFCQSMLYKKKDYAVYLLEKEFDEEKYKKIVEMLGTDWFGAHAGNLETSSMMSIDESLVKMDSVEEAGLVPDYKRTKHLGPVYTPIWWYGSHPTHQAGEPFKAKKEVGEFSRELSAKALAEQIKIIKNDDITLKIQNEFFEKAENPLGKYPEVPKPEL